MLTADAAEPDRDGFGWTVLGATCLETVDVHAKDGRLTIAVTKMREAVQT